MKYWRNKTSYERANKLAIVENWKFLPFLLSLLICAVNENFVMANFLYGELWRKIKNCLPCQLVCIYVYYRVSTAMPYHAVPCHLAVRTFVRSFHPFGRFVWLDSDLNFNWPFVKGKPLVYLWLLILYLHLLACYIYLPMRTSQTYNRLIYSVTFHFRKDCAALPRKLYRRFLPDILDPMKK